MTSAAEVKKALADVTDKTDAANLARYFKTAPGDYGEGDVFIGVRVPAARVVAKRFRDLPEPAIEDLLASDVHEHRFVALAIMVLQFQKTRSPQLVDAYLVAVSAGRVNNWDLVDSSAEYILGEFLYGGDRGILFELAASESLWERRVAVLSTFAFIKHGDASTTLELARLLLGDRHDLMQKAVGWMLREVGKRVDPALLIGFLDENAGRMPRTMLSYATEHLTSEQRTHYRTIART